MTPTTISDLIKTATKEIKKSPAIDHWQDGREQDDAEVLLAHVLDMDSEDFDFTATVTNRQAQKFSRLVERRVSGEPVALITGEFEFRGIHLRTRPGVFIPRYSSEYLVVLAAATLRRRKEKIAVDVCTGAGATPIALAKEVKGAVTYGIDIAADAVKLSQENARNAKVSGVRFLRGDLLSPLPRTLRGRVSLFTMHPPYVARDELRDLPREIKDWEPAHTLTDNSEDGLGFVRTLADQAPEWLTSRGLVMIEIGPHLARKAATIFRRAGYRDVASKRDDIGATRVVTAVAPRQGFR